MSRQQGTTIEDIQREAAKLRARSNSASSKRALKTAARYVKNKIRQAQKSKKSGATKGAGSYNKIGKAVAFLVSKHTGSKRGDPYSQDQAGALLVCTNALGMTAQERAAEWRLEELKHPGVLPERLINHISISRPTGHELDLKVWADSVVPTFLAEAGIEGMYVATLHTSTKNQHVHLVYSRSQPNGELLTDSMDFFILMKAAQRTAKRLNLEVPDFVPTHVQAPSDRVVSAKRRAERLGTNPKVWVEPAIVKDCLARSKNLEDFAKRLGQKGIEVKQSTRPDGQVTGVLFQNSGSGSDQWLSGSTISRELTLPKLNAQIEKNTAAAAKAVPKNAPAPMPKQRPAAPAPAPVPPKPQQPQFQSPRERG